MMSTKRNLSRTETTNGSDEVWLLDNNDEDSIGSDYSPSFNGQRVIHATTTTATRSNHKKKKRMPKEDWMDDDVSDVSADENDSHSFRKNNKHSLVANESGIDMHSIKLCTLPTKAKINKPRQSLKKKKSIESLRILRKELLSDDDDDDDNDAFDSSSSFRNSSSPVRTRKTNFHNLLSPQDSIKSTAPIVSSPLPKPQQKQRLKNDNDDDDDDTNESDDTTELALRLRRQKSLERITSPSKIISKRILRVDSCESSNDDVSLTSVDRLLENGTTKTSLSSYKRMKVGRSDNNKSSFLHDNDLNELLTGKGRQNQQWKTDYTSMNRIINRSESMSSEDTIVLTQRIRQQQHKLSPLSSSSKKLDSNKTEFSLLSPQRTNTSCTNDTRSNDVIHTFLASTKRRITLEGTIMHHEPSNKNNHIRDADDDCQSNNNNSHRGNNDQRLLLKDDASNDIVFGNHDDDDSSVNIVQLTSLIRQRNNNNNNNNNTNGSPDQYEMLTKQQQPRQEENSLPTKTASTYDDTNFDQADSKMDADIFVDNSNEDEDNDDASVDTVELKRRIMSRTTQPDVNVAILMDATSSEDLINSSTNNHDDDGDDVFVLPEQHDDDDSSSSSSSSLENKDDIENSARNQNLLPAPTNNYNTTATNCNSIMRNNNSRISDYNIASLLPTDAGELKIPEIARQQQKFTTTVVKNPYLPKPHSPNSNTERRKAPSYHPNVAAQLQIATTNTSSLPSKSIESQDVIYHANHQDATASKLDVNNSKDSSFLYQEDKDDHMTDQQLIESAFFYEDSKDICDNLTGQQAESQHKNTPWSENKLTVHTGLRTPKPLFVPPSRLNPALPYFDPVYTPYGDKTSTCKSSHLKLQPTESSQQQRQQELIIEDIESFSDDDDKGFDSYNPNKMHLHHPRQALHLGHTKSYMETNQQDFNLHNTAASCSTVFSDQQQAQNSLYSKTQASLHHDALLVPYQNNNDDHNYFNHNHTVVPSLYHDDARNRLSPTVEAGASYYSDIPSNYADQANFEYGYPCDKSMRQKLQVANGSMAANFKYLNNSSTLSSHTTVPHVNASKVTESRPARRVRDASYNPAFARGVVRRKFNATSSNIQVQQSNQIVRQHHESSVPFVASDQQHFSTSSTQSVVPQAATGAIALANNIWADERKAKQMAVASVNQARNDLIGGSGVGVGSFQMVRNSNNQNQNSEQAVNASRPASSSSSRLSSSKAASKASSTSSKSKKKTATNKRVTKKSTKSKKKKKGKAGSKSGGRSTGTSNYNGGAGGGRSKGGGGGFRTGGRFGNNNRPGSRLGSSSSWDGNTDDPNLQHVGGAEMSF